MEASRPIESLNNRSDGFGDTSLALKGVWCPSQEPDDDLFWDYGPQPGAAAKAAAEPGHAVARHGNGVGPPNGTRAAAAAPAAALAAEEVSCASWMVLVESIHGARFEDDGIGDKSSQSSS